MADGGAWAAIAQIVLDWIKTPWKVLTVIFVLCTFGLVAPKTWIEAIGMTASVHNLWPWLVVGSAASGLLLVITGVEELAKPVFSRRKSKKETEEKYRRIEGTLQSLKSDEIGALTQFNAGSSTQDFHPTDGIPKNLMLKGILRVVNDTGYIVWYGLTEDMDAFVADRGFQTISEAIKSLKKAN
jgi:hypothetical protein